VETQWQRICRCGNQIRAILIYRGNDTALRPLATGYIENHKTHRVKDPTLRVGTALKILNFSASDLEGLLHRFLCQSMIMQVAFRILQQGLSPIQINRCKESILFRRHSVTPPAQISEHFADKCSCARIVYPIFPIFSTQNSLLWNKSQKNVTFKPIMHIYKAESRVFGACNEQGCVKLRILFYQIILGS
jgi:hypothetical protein